MMDETKFTKILPLLLLPIAIYSIQRFTSLPLGNTTIWWGIHGLILFVFFWESRYSTILPEDKKATLILKIYLLWNVLSIFRGAFFMAESYWDYKGLVTMGMTLLIPLVVYSVLDIGKLQAMFVFYIKYVIPFFLLLIPFLGMSSWGWYFFPISLLIFFFPVLPSKGKYTVLIISILVVVTGLAVRSYIIKYLVPFVILFFYYFRSIPFVNKAMRMLRMALLIVPWILFILAVTGTFNVFNMSDYIQGDIVEVMSTEGQGGNASKSTLVDDSRTFLYIEVLSSAIKYDYWLLGRSPARGNETVWFAREMEETVGKPERLRNETGILNIFTWTGVVGTVLFFFVFYRSSYLAIRKSNNIYIKLIGVFVALRWVYSWVEDYQAFDLNWLIIWVMIGMCFSTSFREMEDEEVKLWARGIFSKRHYVAFKKYRIDIASDT